jgi:hypothetical protein
LRIERVISLLYGNTGASPMALYRPSTPDDAPPQT